MLVLVYRKCSTCQKALRWLEEHKIFFEERAIVEENPTYEELKEWYGRSGMPLKKFFNTSGMLYKQMNLKDKLPEMTEDEQLKLLATDGMLVKRPLVVGEDFVLTGFREKEWGRENTGVGMIPLKLETLLAGRTVEQNRVEYKEGWNPNDIIHTICAFANDLHNVNGGYLVIGIRAEDGIPVLPPKGLPMNILDSVQQEIFQYCNLITPRYIPRIEVVNYENTGIYLIYLWCSAGDSGPYQAPVDVYAEKGKKKDRRMQYWIRPSSLTAAADREEIAELFDKFNSIPFDDRINRKASVQDIRRGYLEDFLRDSRSSLADEINKSSMEDLLLSLEVADETDTELSIRNIGVLMFTDRPDRFIPGAQIDLVKFNTEEAEGSDDFFEKTFYGPIWKQVRDVLDYINTNIIEEKVVKIQGTG